MKSLGLEPPESTYTRSRLYGRKIPKNFSPGMVLNVEKGQCDFSENVAVQYISTNQKLCSTTNNEWLIISGISDIL